MADDQITTYYKEKIRQLDEHLKESPLFRDKIFRLELRLDMLEKQVMKNAIIGGIIGALIGSGAAPALTHLIDAVFRVM